MAAGWKIVLLRFWSWFSFCESSGWPPSRALSLTGDFPPFDHLPGVEARELTLPYSCTARLQAGNLGSPRSHTPARCQTRNALHDKAGAAENPFYSITYLLTYSLSAKAAAEMLSFLFRTRKCWHLLCSGRSVYCSVWFHRSLFWHNLSMWFGHHFSLHSLQTCLSGPPQVLLILFKKCLFFLFKLTRVGFFCFGRFICFVFGKFRPW